MECQEKYEGMEGQIAQEHYGFGTWKVKNQQWNTSLSQLTAGIRQKCVNSKTTKQNNNYNNQNTNRKGNRNNNIHRKQARVLMTLRFTHNYAQRGETKRVPVIRRQRL